MMRNKDLTPEAGDPFALAERPLIAYKAVGGRSLRLQFAQSAAHSHAVNAGKFGGFDFSPAVVTKVLDCNVKVSGAGAFGFL